MDRRFQKRIAGYLARQRRAALAELADIDVNDWFDYWHVHPDIWAKANRAKPMVALLTYELLLCTEAVLATREGPAQIWATLCEHTQDNSVLIHSPNPGGTPFPEPFDGVVWGVPVPPEAHGIIQSTHEVGKLVREGELMYFIRAKKTGHSLQA